MIRVPMESLDPLMRECIIEVEKTECPKFTTDNVFKAVGKGDKTQLDDLLQYLQENKQKLSTDFLDKDRRTALMKALMNLKDGKNDTIEVLLETAEKNDELKELINAPCEAPHLKGFTALHAAIERRNLEYVKLLIEKGADVTARATGTFFKNTSKKSFYFGELPLSLAACTNQEDIVTYLIRDKKVDVKEQDSEGNTVLHALVATADNTEENTKVLSHMYDQILIENYELKENNDLESIKNKVELNSLQLAAKLGKTEMLKHIMNRRFPEEERRPLSRKFIEWVCGPVQSSLYDMTSIDTRENNSVLEIIIFKSKEQNRPEMLQIEPLHSLLKDKWKKFASRIFWIQFVLYVLYLAIFTTVAYYRKDGQPPFPVETTGDSFHYVGGFISVIGAIRLLFKSIALYWRRRKTMKGRLNRKSQNINGCFEGLFFLQAALLLLSVVMYFCGLQDYIEILVLSVALAWGNLLYFARGIKKLGIYVVMMQRMILSDLLHFLYIYSVLLLGFSAAVVTLLNDPPTTPNNTTDCTQAQVGSNEQKKRGYHELRFTLVEMFKFTIGMGNLDFTDEVENKFVFHILLICYILLTYILMLNMLIAVMSNTVEKTSEESRKIWKLQRAFTTLDMEKTTFGRMSCLSTTLVNAWFDEGTDPKYFRVTEKNWEKWSSDIGKMVNTDFSGDIENDNVKEVFKKGITPQLWKSTVRQLLKKNKRKDE